MKTAFIKVLANKDGLKDKKLYNRLLELYAKVAGVKQVYFYQLGYTPQKLENLKYEVKKQLAITDKEIALYVPGEDDDDIDLEFKGSATIQTAGKTAEEIIAELNAKTVLVPNPILTGMDVNAQQGLKLRDEYPFLNDSATPDAFKILVSDKITAYKDYAAKHAEALEAADAGEAEDRLYEMASGAIKDYQLNQEIKDELDFYRDSKGKVLGKHPLLADLKLNQDVGEMSEADLLKARNNGLKSVSKYKGDKEKAHLYVFHSRKLELVTGRLVNDFKMQFDK